MDVSDLEVFKSAMLNALHDDLTLNEVCDLLRHAHTVDDFDEAVALYTIGAIDTSIYRFEWTYR